MKFPQSTLLAKINAPLAFVALIIFIVAFSTNYWLEKDFFFPVNAGGVATIPVRVNMGLFTACRVEHYPNNQSSEVCSPEGAADWQKIAAGLSVAALVLAVVGTALAILALTSHRLAAGLKVKLCIVACYFLTCDFSMGPLIMFPTNRRIQVKPNMSPFQVDFDLAWSYTVSAVSIAMFALLVLLNIVDIVWSHSCDEEHRKEDRKALTDDAYTVSTEPS